MEQYNKQDVVDDIHKFKAITAIANQEGGKILIDNLREDIKTDVEGIIGLFRGDEIELRCAIAKLKADLGLYRVLIRAEDNAKLAEEALAKFLEIEVH